MRSIQSVETQERDIVIILGGVPYQANANQTSLQTAAELSSKYDVWYVARHATGATTHSIKDMRRWCAWTDEMRDGVRVIHLPFWFQVLPISRPKPWRRLISKLIVRGIRSLLRSGGTPRARLICYWWFLPEVASCLNWTSTVFDVIDLHWDREKHSRKVATEHYRLAVQTAQNCDRVTTVSEGLKAELYSAGISATCLPNGLSLSRFAHIVRNHHRSRIAVYAGGLDTRIDTDLLVRTAKTNDEWLFLIVGEGESSKTLRGVPNMLLLGDCAHETVLRLLNHARVGLIPFLPSQYLASSNLMKLYDYIGSGTAVLATPAVQVDHLDHDFRQRIYVEDRNHWDAVLDLLGREYTPVWPDLASHSSSQRVARLIGTDS